jgi:hypothetical protein
MQDPQEPAPAGAGKPADPPAHVGDHQFSHPVVAPVSPRPVPAASRQW